MARTTTRTPFQTEPPLDVKHLDPQWPKAEIKNTLIAQPGMYQVTKENGELYATCVVLWIHVELTYPPGDQSRSMPRTYIIGMTVLDMAKRVDLLKLVATHIDVWYTTQPPKNATVRR